MAAIGTGLLVLIDDVTADRSSRMTVVSAQIHLKAANRQSFAVQMDNHPKRTAKETQVSQSKET